MGGGDNTLSERGPRGIISPWVWTSGGGEGIREWNKRQGIRLWR